jgi:hypothetical protein
MVLSQTQYPRVISMRPFIVKRLDYDLTPVAGLALVGHHLNRLAPIFKQLDAALPVRNSVANSDILRIYLNLLVQGKSDLDAIENFRGDALFKQALGIKLLPSSPTLRQRMHARAEYMFDFLPTLIESLLDGTRVDYGVLPCGWLPLDVDTFAMGNGDTAKDGVGRTYTGVDGYWPLAAYLGSHGCESHCRAVRRPRHARAVPLRVQDRPRPGAAALGQVQHQLPGVRARSWPRWP